MHGGQTNPSPSKRNPTSGGQDAHTGRSCRAVRCGERQVLLARVIARCLRATGQRVPGQRQLTPYRAGTPWSLPGPQILFPPSTHEKPVGILEPRWRGASVRRRLI
jgi:hypothetical protein